MVRVLVLMLLWTPLAVDAQDLSTEDQAVVFFERAREAFELGDFERANLLLREAITLDDVAPLHYNLARSLQELGQWREARDEYRTFLRMDPETPERTRVESRIRLLDERIDDSAERTPAPEPGSGDESDLEVTTQPETDPEAASDHDAPRRTASPLPWVVFGGGLVVVAGGATVGLLSRSSLSAARDAADHADAAENLNTAERQSLTANILFGVGGALALGGLVWALVGRRRSDTAARIDIGPGSVQLRHSF